MTQGWVKVYYRDKDKVMRAIPGIRMLPGQEIAPRQSSLLTLDKSVYTLDKVPTKISDKIWIRSK